MNSHVSFHHFVVSSDVSVILALYPHEYKQTRFSKRSIEMVLIIKIYHSHIYIYIYMYIYRKVQYFASNVSSRIM